MISGGRSVSAACSESSHSCQLRVCACLFGHSLSASLSVCKGGGRSRGEEVEVVGEVVFSLMINLQSFKYLLSWTL